jgi:hypothetical protein
MSTAQRKSKKTNPSSDAKENLDHNNSMAQSVVEPKTDNNLPFAILIDFDDYVGPKFFPENDSKRNWIPINPLNIFSKISKVSRTNYPIRFAYALTIHKSQGQTLRKIIVKLGKKESTLGITFVALSRVKNVKDFLIPPFPLDRLTKIKNSKMLEIGVNEEKRIYQIVNKTHEKYQFLFN